jgi:hypothetical protein
MDKDSIIIASEALNTIKLDELSLVDRANGSSNLADLKAASEVDDKLMGLNVPFISINGYNVSNFLSQFNLDLNGFLPVIRFSFIAGESVFISANYPKDGDLISLYMRSPGDYYKPIRMDFTVLSVHSEPSSRYSKSGSDPEAKGVNLRFSIIGECKIPGIYANRIKAFKNLNSHDALLEVSQELNLGFCSNDKTLNDEMTWICPNYSYYDFIQEVSFRAYKDDEESFFDSWIDPYYNLNFVNLGNQFSYSKDPEWKALIVPGYTAAGLKTDSAIPGTSAPEPTQMPLVLTNLTGFGTIPYFINGYTLTSRSGNNTNETGYILELGFYDEDLTNQDPSEKYIKYPIESQTPQSLGTGTILQKGRARDNEYKKETRREWLGVLNTRTDSESGGVHENFLHAKYQNLMNIKDVTKMTLEIELMDFFPGIYRGQVLPVGIYVSDPSGLRQQNTGNTSNRDANTSISPTRDEFLSGNYVVMGMSIYWNKGTPGMKQQLTLAKRSWTPHAAGAIPKAYPISVTKSLF